MSAMFGAQQSQPVIGLGAGRARPDILDIDALDQDAWDDLQRRAEAAHPFFSRHVVAAHRAAGLLPAGLRMVTVRSGDRLDALMPFSLRRDIGALGGLVGTPFVSPYVTSTAPIVARDASADTMASLAEGLAIASGGRAWRWPLLSTGTGSGAALLAALQRQGWTHGVVAGFERPILLRRESQEAFLEGHSQKGRFKDLRRRLRRLEEQGEVAFATATGGEPLRSLLEAFLVLEKAGWKGHAGTALACRAGTASFARTLFNPDGGPIGTRADALTLDGRPIAISLALTGGGTATLLKTAYDETLRAFAPGLLLEAEIARLCHATGFADRLDSATLPGSPLEGLYRESEYVAEVIAVPPGRDMLSIDRRLRLARFEQSGRERAKRILKPKKP